MKCILSETILPPGHERHPSLSHPPLTTHDHRGLYVGFLIFYNVRSLIDWIREENFSEKEDDGIISWDQNVFSFFFCEKKIQFRLINGQFVTRKIWNGMNTVYTVR